MYLISLIQTRFRTRIAAVGLRCPQVFRDAIVFIVGSSITWIRVIAGSLSLLACPAMGASTGHLDIMGISGALKNNVLAHLSLANETCDAPETRVRQRLESSDKEIKTALQALGRYRPTISSSISFDGKCWQAKFDIKPGPAVKIESLKLEITGEATQDAAFDQLQKNLPLKTGDELRHDLYQKTKDTLTDLAARRGYLDAHFTQALLLVDPPRDRAEVTLAFDSGVRYHLGQIQVEQHAYDQALVQNMVTLKPGETYDADRLRAQHEAFTTSGLFESVLIQPQMEARAQGEVPVNIRLEPRKRHSYSVGAGVSTDTGPQLKLGYENRRLNSAGHSLTADISASPVVSEFKLGYRIPLRRAATDSLGFDAGFHNEDTDTSSSRTLALGARHTIGRPHDWIETRYLQLSREDFRVGGESNTAVLLMPGVSFARRAVDDPVHPSRGIRLRGEIRGATETLVSSVSFGQLLGETKWIRPLPAKLRLITRSQVGFTAQSRFQDLPASVRFFAGGDSSVRGYDYQALGPRNSDGNVVGGRYLLVGSVELERSVFGNFGIAPFFDIGNAINNINDPLATSAGLGIRWRSPLGPVGVDFAHPFYQSDEVVRLHLRFGPEI